MKGKQKNLMLALRRILRHLAAALLWAHALFATNFIHISPTIHLSIENARISPSLVGDIVLITFIFFYGFVCDFGWASAWFDIVYIYLWPFVLIFKGLFVSGRYLWRKYNSSNEAVAQAEAISDVVPKKERSPKSPHVAVRVFGQFALIWGAIIVNTDIKIIAVVATIAALYGALRASYNLWDFISDAIDWIEGLESPFAKHLADAIKSIREADEKDQSQQVKSAANTLRMAERVCNFLAKQKRILAKITRVTAFCITVPFYVYISSIFATIYLGIAKIEGISLDWRAALIDSLFVPIAFTDLPHSFLIRLVAGIQAIVIGAMGYNVLFRHFTSKINRLSDAALELQRPLQDRELMSRVALHADSLTLKPKPVASQTVQTPESENAA